MRLFAAALCLSVVACASSSAPPPPAVPDWTSIPSLVVQALCHRLKDDAVATGTVAMVTTTQPIATQATMGALQQAYFKKAPGDRVTAALATSHAPMPIEIAGSGCALQGVERLDPSSQADMMVIELSAPLPNPYLRNESGVLARLSLGGEAPTWYWIPLRFQQGAWAVEHILPLEAR